MIVIELIAGLLVFGLIVNGYHMWSVWTTLTEEAFVLARMQDRLDSIEDAFDALRDGRHYQADRTTRDN